jgi:hypothetical protein
MRLPGTVSAEQRRRKVPRTELHEVLQRLSDAEKEHRQPELAGYRA